MIACITETVLLLIYFTVSGVTLIKKCQANPELAVFSYPRKIVERLVELGKVQKLPETVPIAQRITRKAPAVVLGGAAVGLIFYFVNGFGDFFTAAVTAYVMWLIADWFDCLILDCVWFCHAKSCVLPGTEDMVKEYHDYLYHLKGALIAMLTGLPTCIAAGIAVQIITMLVK